MSVGVTATARGIGVRRAARARRHGASASNRGDGRQAALRGVRCAMTLIGVPALPSRRPAIVVGGEDRRPVQPATAVGVGGRRKEVPAAVARAGPRRLGAPLHRRETMEEAAASGWVASVGRLRRATAQRLTARIGSAGGLVPVLVTGAACRAKEGGGTVTGPRAVSRAAKVLAAPPDPKKIAPVRTVTAVGRRVRSRRIGPVQEGPARSGRSESAKVGGRDRVVTSYHAASGRWAETNGRCARHRRRLGSQMMIDAQLFPAHLVSRGVRLVGNAIRRPRPQPVRRLDRSDSPDPRLFRSSRPTLPSHPKKWETVLAAVVVVRRRR